jgi:GNAT superfamily N-acetyltransferase
VSTDGAIGGSALGAIQPWVANVVFAMVSVLPDHRRRGAGTAMYGAISEWARSRALDTIDTVVATDDLESLAFAQRRGFVERSRELGVALDLTRTTPLSVEPPDGIDRLVGGAARWRSRSLRGRPRGGT